MPVFRDNFPDPQIVVHQGEFIAYATNAGINLPMLSSRDLVHWSWVTGPDAPAKRLDGMPELAALGEGRLHLGARGDEDRRTLAALLHGQPPQARRPVPRRRRRRTIRTGPFRDSSAEPLVCQFDLGGTIDANPFRDSDGKLYLYYKSDGNRVGKKTTIWGQRLPTTA